MSCTRVWKGKETWTDRQTNEALSEVDEKRRVNIELNSSAEPEVGCPYLYKLRYTAYRHGRADLCTGENLKKRKIK